MNMDLKYMSLVVLWYISIIVRADEQFCIPLAKMQQDNSEEIKGGTGCATKGYLDALTKQLYTNISSVIVANKEKCGPTKSDFATKEDIETLKEMLNSVITTLAHGAPDNNQTDIGTRKSRDCQEIQSQGYNSTGVYTVYPDLGANGISVRCDMQTTVGGWIVIQRRISDSDFYKTWCEYENGFGNLTSNFWLGNRYIHTISNQGRYGLRVDLTSMNGEKAYVEYSTFSIGDAESGYKLSVSGYSGTAGDSLTSRGNGMKFSTYDRDTDTDSDQCSVRFHGAWWYDSCHTSNLNGDYGNTGYAKGPVWQPWKGYYSPMKFTEMKIRRFE